MMAGYSSPEHWEDTKQKIIQSLRDQGVSETELPQRLAFLINAMRQGGNIPAGHPDAMESPEAVVKEDNPLGKPWPDTPNPRVTPPPSPPQGSPPVTPASTAPPSVPTPFIGPPQNRQGSSPVQPEEPSIFDNPEAVNAVLGMGGRNRQIAYAEGLRDKEVPGGRYVSGGRVYVPSSLLEHAVTGYGRYKGQKDLKRLEQEQMDAKRSIIDALRRRVPSSTPPIMPEQQNNVMSRLRGMF